MENYTNNQRGSDWRKWDLHIHTPFSYLNSEFGNDWDLYVKTLFLKAIEYEISAIGITDYFTIDGYKKIKQEYLDNPEKLKALFSPEEIEKISSILVIPNIEFRLNKLVGQSRINFHVLLSNEVSINDIEENFLHEIDFVYEAGPQSEDEKRKLKFNNLEQLGRKLIQEHPKFNENSEIFIGMMNAVVDDGQVCNLLLNKKNIFEGKYFIALPCDEDLSKVSWNGQDHQARKLLIQKSDILIATNPNTINWALGKKHSTPEDFIKEYKSLKPCIGGSDAHTFDELFVKSGDRKVWIKSDPTFEGLKQVIFEPDSRVSIQENTPEEKAGYQVIERIEINSQYIYNSEIRLNPNLNSIIGGRSTGKSVLLAAIAKKLKTERPIVFLHKPDYNSFVDDISKELKIFWKDGEDLNDREIEYFEQGYMYDLSRDDNKLSTLIQNILIQQGKEVILSDHNKFLSENRKTISDSINDYFLTVSEINDRDQKISDKGDKLGIEEEIKRLTIELNALDVNSYNEQEKSIHDSHKDIIDFANKNISTSFNDISRLQELKTTTLFKELYSTSVISLSDSKRKDMELIFSKLKLDFEIKWREELDKIISTSHLDINISNQSIFTSSSDATFLKVSRIFSESRQLRELQERIKTEKDKLFVVNQLIKEIEELIKKKMHLKQKIKDCHQEYYQKKLELRHSLSESKDELNINAIVKFNNIRYKDILQSALNLQGALNQSISNFDYSENDLYETHIFSLFDKLLDNQLTLKSGYSNESLTVALLSDTFYQINYDIVYEGDDFKKMSDGKKAFVVLKLLLDFSNKKCPILIDQPEDDLDNRAIYNDLVKYLRNKKSLRQIILATHNPNIVVAADSELVIVANQHGLRSSNRGERKFQYASGSLENSIPKDSDINLILESQGIREHVCEILEGGRTAFKLREKKYGLPV